MVENTPGPTTMPARAIGALPLPLPKEAFVRGDKPKGGAGSDGDPGGGGLDPFGYYKQRLCAEDIQQLVHFKAI